MALSFRVKMRQDILNWLLNFLYFRTQNLITKKGYKNAEQG